MARKSGLARHMGSEMRAYAAGKMHSGSKKGPVVTSRKQAIAIALSTARDKHLKGAPKAPKKK